MSIYMTKEEVDEKINSGDAEVINGVLTGDVIIGEAPAEDAVQDTVEQTTTIEEAGTDTVPESTDTTESDKYAELLAKYQAETVKSKTVAKDASFQADEAKKARDILEQIKSSPVSSENRLAYNAPNISEDDTDEDLAGRYSKNNRAMLDSLTNTIKGAASVDQISALEKKLNSLLEIEESRNVERERIAAKDADDNRMNKLFSEVDAFANGHKNFQMDRDTASVFKDINSFKSRLKEFLRTEDTREVEKAYRSVVSGEDVSLIENLGKANIKSPEGAESYLKLAEIVDLKNGYKFNKFTGEYEELKDDFGVRVSQRSIEDAYKLSRFSDIVAEAKAEQTKAIDERLSSRANSATTLPLDVSSDGSGQGPMTPAEVEQILSLPNSAFKKNPALKQKLDAILGM